MSEKHYDFIKQRYENKGDDFAGAFRAILATADEIGLDQTLAYLEQCVTEKRLAWTDANLDALLSAPAHPVRDAYHIFYEVYLGVSAPQDGEIVSESDTEMVTRWWNACPLLEACKELGLDTRDVCKKAYHKPVQALMARIDPRLKFERNYEFLRPHTPYCEEIISLTE